MKLLQCTLIIILSSITWVEAQPIEQYHPSDLNQQTSEIVDSVINLLDSTINYIEGNSLNECRYLNYWDEQYRKIPAQDFFNLINHKSPIIRYHSYQYILENNLVNSSKEFINYHSDDLEYVLLANSNWELNELRWELIDNKWIKTSYGTMPLILHIIKGANLSMEENEVLYRNVLQKNHNNDDRIIEYLLRQLNTNESNYSTIKMIAKLGNVSAIEMLAVYLKEENQEFLLAHLDLLCTKKEESNNSKFKLHKRKFITHSVKYDYPIGAIDKFKTYYENLKMTDFEEYTWYESKYVTYAKNNTPIRRNLMYDLLSNASSASIVKKNEIYGRIDSLLKYVPEHEILDFRFEYWKQSSKCSCSVFYKMERHNKKMAFEIAKSELDKLEIDKFNNKYLSCFRNFIYLLQVKYYSVEKYINYALQSKNRHLASNALNASRKFSFESSKTHIMNLMKTDNKVLDSRNIINTLSNYQLNEEEKRKIDDWVKQNSVLENITIEKWRREIESDLIKMGIEK